MMGLSMWLTNGVDLRRVAMQNPQAGRVLETPHTDLRRTVSGRRGHFQCKDRENTILSNDPVQRYRFSPTFFLITTTTIELTVDSQSARRLTGSLLKASRDRSHSKTLPSADAEYNFFPFT